MSRTRPSRTDATASNDPAGVVWCRIRSGSLESWLPRLVGEWSGSRRNGAELWRRLRGMGFAGSVRVMTEWATRLRRAEAAPAGRP